MNVTQLIDTAARTNWSDVCPTKSDAGDSYYFVRRKDKLDVVVMGFSMGKGWLNGVSYEPSEMRNHLFLGPITPKLFTEIDLLRELLTGYFDEHKQGTPDDRCYCLLCERTSAALEPEGDQS